jgi:hypothetical protein
MSTKTETAEAFAERVYVLFGSIADGKMARAAALITERDALRDDAYEERIRELEADLAGLSRRWKGRVNSYEQRIASLEAQLATARAETLREAIAAVEEEIDEGTERYAEAHERGYDASILSASQNQCAGLRYAKGAVEKLLTSPPPRVDGWIPFPSIDVAWTPGEIPPLDVPVLGWNLYGKHAHRVTLREDGDGYHWWCDEVDEALDLDEEHGPWISHWRRIEPPTQPDAGTEET